MCSLRTLKGVNPTVQLRPYFPSDSAFYACVTQIEQYALAHPGYFQEASRERIALTPVKGFLVSNHLIAQLLVIVEKSLS